MELQITTDKQSAHLDDLFFSTSGSSDTASPAADIIKSFTVF